MEDKKRDEEGECSGVWRNGKEGIKKRRKEGLKKENRTCVEEKFSGKKKRKKKKEEERNAVWRIKKEWKKK